MSVRGIGINNFVAMIVRIIFILLALWIEGVGFLEIIWSILEIIWSMADIISAAAAAAATAAAAEAETEASTTILSVNILYLRACASALTCRDRAADPAGMPPDTTPGPDVVGMDSAAQGLGCGAISLCDWWLIPGHYGILPNRLYWLLGADVIGSAGEDEWYSLTAALRIVPPHWSQARSRTCSSCGSDEGTTRPGRDSALSATERPKGDTLGSHRGDELHITCLPFGAVGLLHCVGIIANAMGGLVLRPPLPACSLAEVILGQTCRALHTWFSRRFDHDGPGGCPDGPGGCPNTILREQIRAYRERGAVMVPGEVGEMRADIALLEHQLAATMLHVDLPPLPPWIDIDVTAVGASGGALAS